MLRVLVRRAKVLCNEEHPFKFKPMSVVLGGLDRREIGDFDALFLGLSLIAMSKNDVCVRDGGFYLRDGHVSLIREGRLNAQVNTLGVVKRKAPDLYDALLTIEHKTASVVTYPDAAELAKYLCEHAPGSNGYDTFINRGTEGALCLGRTLLALARCLRGRA